MDANDIGSVAKLGVGLSSCLVIHSEVDRMPRRLLPKLVAVVNSTASTLGKIHDLIQGNSQVFTEAGMNDIESLTTTCRKIYTGIIIMLVRQTRSVKRDKDTSSLLEEQAETLLAYVTNNAICSYDSWNWLELRLRYCQHLLTQLKFELMMRYLLGSIANHQLMAKTRAPGDLNTECSLVVHAGHVVSRWRSHHKHISKKMDIWNKVDSPVPSSESSVEDFSFVTKLFGKPGKDPSKPPSIATTVCDVKPVEVVIPTEVKTPEPTKDIEVAVEANDDEQVDNKPVGKDEQSLTSAFKSWLKRVFLPDTEDWKDQDLEVWQVDISLQYGGTSSKGHRKLDIDDRQIRSSLAQATSHRRWRKRPELIEQYGSLDKRVRQRIDKAIDAAKQTSSRERTWIAMSVTNEPFKIRATIQAEASISLFFRLGQEVEPIYILDMGGGRKVPFPYASFATFEMMKEMVVKNYAHRYYCVQTGNYIICTEDHAVMVPESWESIRRPGMVLKVMPRNGPIPVNPQPPYMFQPIPNVVTVSSPARPSKPFQPRPPKMKPIHLEMKDTLQVSYPLLPEETFKLRLRELLELWTNAIDCFVELENDDSSEYWTSSSSSESCSTGSGSDSDSDRSIAD
ncbi:hypothetical protein DER45DRAFT_570791 [Fusarium avenaceum]|nr:hypothetical protein DER45DRAFT_570791 [Fusarium avenaceum]